MKGKALKIIVVMMVLTITFILILLVLSDRAVERAGTSRSYDTLSYLPDTKAALVLGTSRYRPGGRTNLFFRYRLEAAKELLDAGKVEYLILSGDNQRLSYNEPVEMKKAMIDMGVDPQHLILDYAGFRTLDSVIRCKEVFGQEPFIVVSQRFHNSRALYIAGSYGIEAYAYNARDVQGVSGLKVRMRESLARVKAVLDIRLLGTKPRYLGESVTLPD